MARAREAAGRGRADLEGGGRGGVGGQRLPSQRRSEGALRGPRVPPADAGPLRHRASRTSATRSGPRPSMRRPARASGSGCCARARSTVTPPTRAPAGARSRSWASTTACAASPRRRAVRRCPSRRCRGPARGLRAVHRPRQVPRGPSRPQMGDVRRRLQRSGLRQEQVRHEAGGGIRASRGGARRRDGGWRARRQRAGKRCRKRTAVAALAAGTSRVRAARPPAAPSRR